MKKTIISIVVLLTISIFQPESTTAEIYRKISQIPDSKLPGVCVNPDAPRKGCDLLSLQPGQSWKAPINRGGDFENGRKANMPCAVQDGRTYRMVSSGRTVVAKDHRKFVIR